MQLGATSGMYSHAGVPAEQSLERFIRLGLKYVNIATIGDLNLRYLNAKKVDRLRRSMERLDVVPSCLSANVGGNGASSNAELRNRTVRLLTNAMGVASELGFRMVLFHPGEKEVGTTSQQRWDNMKLFIEQCLKQAEREKIVLTFESNPRIFRMINSIDEMTQLLRELSSFYLKATVDMGHMTIVREAPSEITKLQGQIVHAHITDNDGTADTNEALGTGITPIAECLQELHAAGIEETARQCGLEAVAVIELGSPEKVSLRSVDRILERSLEYLQKCASPFLQGL